MTRTCISPLAALAALLLAPAALLLAPAALLLAPAARAQTVFVTGHHDNQSDGVGYTATFDTFVVPADTSSGPQATFNDNSDTGLDTAKSSVTILGGQFDGNGNYGLYALDAALTVTGGQFNGNTVIGLFASDYVTASISGGQYDNNGTGVLADNDATVTVTGGVFSGNTFDFASAYSASMDIYGQFSGLTPGQTQLLSPNGGTFTGTLAHQSSPAQTFTYSIQEGGTITLHDVAPAPEPSACVALLVSALGLGLLTIRARRHAGSIS